MDGQNEKLRVAFALVLAVILAAGCATPTASIQPRETHTARGTPIKMTLIPTPGAFLGYKVQVSEGAVWTVSGLLGKTKTIRVDTKSHQAAEFARPFVFGTPDLLVEERSIWFSDGLTAVSGRGDLYRVDIDTNQITATIEAVGTPFAVGDGAVWAYNLRTRMVTGIDTKTNQARTKVATQGRGGPRYFAFGDGSIWQFASKDEVSAWQLVRGAAPPSVVRRIDPHTNKVIAEIPVGPYRASAGIYFVAGAIWVLGDRYDRGGFATRIDVKTNQIAATIALKSTRSPYVPVNALPQTPVFWNGGIWISTSLTEVGPSLLMKIDSQMNEVVDEIALSFRQPMLAAGEGALWAVAGGHSVLRIDF